LIYTDLQFQQFYERLAARRVQRTCFIQAKHLSELGTTFRADSRRPQQASISGVFSGQFWVLVYGCVVEAHSI
jgi:hypothetical protein